MARSCFKPAVQPRTHHLDLKRKRFAGQPDTSLESNHLVIANEAGQQLLEGLTVQCPFNANIAADHVDMAVIVMVMVVMAMGLLGGGLVLKAQHNGRLHLSLRHRKQSGTRAHFVFNPPLYLSHLRCIQAVSPAN
ncbi:hypothetical protein Syncc8109_1426 [Synechococcus sp. WH 8109]|nr:hypothetical protein Syncc8109_1426 [Synechococcus sp. WH 8109]